MTDVLILKRIPGHREGEIVPLTPRLQNHVDAGNAKVVPNAHPAWEPEPVIEHQRPLLQAVKAAPVDEDEPSEDEDEPSEEDDAGSEDSESDEDSDEPSDQEKPKGWLR